MSCENLKELLDCEADIVSRHLEEHKKKNGFVSDIEAKADFIDHYGWLMRYMYCEYVCQARESCGTGN